MKSRAAYLLSGLAWATTATAWGEPLPTAPLLRIETGRHTAFIHALVLDEASGKVYSASEDKTIRVWRIGDGRLLDTFRVPAGLRAEGQLYALALSPDRRTLAAAGWTCWDAEQAACIYLLDADTGELRARIAGLEEVVATLRYSPDGSHLAAGMMGTAGLAVYDTRTRKRVAADHEYRGKLLELDFSPHGELLTSSMDGFLRVYDRQFKLSGRVNAGLAGRELFGVRYSPDGRYVAVGFNDVARVSILNSADLSVLRTLKLDGPQAPRNLTRLSWSANSLALAATGEPIAPQNACVFRWVLTQPGSPRQLPLTRARIGDLAVLADDSVLFAAEDPALGLIDAAGRRRYLLLSGVPDFRAAQQSLRVAGDGATIEIGLSNAPQSLRRLSLLRAQLERPPAPDPALNGPATKAPGWKIRQEPALTINNHSVTLEPFETPHAYALAPRTGAMVLGTEWALHVLDRDAAERWTVRMPTVVRAVNVSADERVAVVVLGDGTIHWYALKDGALLASAFLHANGEDWVAWTPQGYYAASPYGDRFVGWQINRGGDTTPDFFRAVQFERTLYRPDLLQGPFTGAPPAPNNPLVDNAPPRVSVQLLPASASTRTRRIRVTAQSLGLPMSDVAAYVNDIPMTPSAGRALRASERLEFVREFDVPINESDNTLRIEVFNGHSLGETEKYVPGVAAPTPPGDLYVLAVGANRFPDLDPGTTLSYSARDAEEFARAMAKAGAGRFRQVHLQTLSDGGMLPVKAAVTRALAALNVANGNDTVVVFLASHGLSDKQGNYYFVPRDATHKDIDTLLDGGSLPAVSSLVGWQEVSEALRNTAGRRLLIVDTCQARQIAGHFQDYSLIKRSASSRLAFILASKGDEESQEYAAGKHGLFTYGLLEGLEPGVTVEGLVCQRRPHSRRAARPSHRPANPAIHGAAVAAGDALLASCPASPWFAYSSMRRQIMAFKPVRIFLFTLLASPAFAMANDQILPPIGGPGGGQFFARCAQGDVLNGVELRTGDDVDAIRPVCITARSPNSIGPRHVFATAYGGDGGGGLTRLICPDDAPAIAGIRIGFEGAQTIIVNNVHLYCSAVSANMPLTTNPSAVFDGPEAKASDNGPFIDGALTFLNFQDESCPQGLVPVGINGRSGKWLDSVGLICGALPYDPTPKPPQPQSQPVKSIGRVNTGSPRRTLGTICDAARDALSRQSPAAPNLVATCRAAGGSATSDPSNADLENVRLRGEYMASMDDAAAGLRNRLDGAARRGFEIGLGAWDHNTAPGPGKQRYHDALITQEQQGFDLAAAYALPRNKHAALIEVGLKIANADAEVGAARAVDPDVFFTMGFDIASGLFGDPAAGSEGSKAMGPGAMEIRNALTLPGRRGFDASTKLHLARSYP